MWGVGIVRPRRLRQPHRGLRLTLSIGSLFSGYGGLDLAVMDVFDAQVVWHCEWEAAPSKILEHHWPHVPNLHDVTQIDWDTVPPVDILTGGYPCQPFSAAGQRKGTTDERHLWPYVREAIRVLRPRYTVLENVAGHRSLGFDRVLGDMAEDGLHVRWTSLRASHVGAPHHRERLFILITPAADDHRIGCGQGTGQPSAGKAEESTDLSSVAALSDTCIERQSGFRWGGRVASKVAETDGGEYSLSNANSVGCKDRSTSREEKKRGAHNQSGGFSSGIDWGSYAPAVRRWERLTRPAPAPTEPNKNGRPRLSAAFAEWMMGLPAGWVTDPTIGISRADQLKAIGNGVCPQQAVAAINSLLDMEIIFDAA